ncbi:hypothetical protein BJY00DRAFT_313989 [Aspergillus carlsbadensis]|nr:hypothetical protein BJY00DRAFT_313989 [Aspergillus carlsbadensis]
MLLPLPLLYILLLLLTHPNPTTAQRQRSLLEYARRDCTGDTTICTNIASGDCCIAGLSNVRSGRCRDCRSRDTYTPYTGGRCRDAERSTTGETCVNVAGGEQTGQRWVRGDRDDDGSGSGNNDNLGIGVGRKGDCAHGNAVEPDLVSVGGRWFVVNGSVPAAAREALWGLWGTGVDWEGQVLPEGLREFEVTGMEGGC